MRKLLKRLVTDESGGEVIDYVLIIALIVVASMTIMNSVGTQVLTRWRRVMDALG
jgi:Flp pilus assembly pilin Flp